jgi:orotate phosphoribosyltransferase
MKLSEGEADEVLGRLSFKRRLAGKDLIVAMARCWTTGEVLMQAYMNREAARLTLTTGMVTYWSTSRDELWVKGETSGDRQELKGFSIDCDGDAILLDVNQSGPACHTGLDTCFDTYRNVGEEDIHKELVNVIKAEALALGEFTLTSGRKSNYYLDIKKAITKPQNLSLIARLIVLRKIGGVDVIAGPELGAIPIVASVALTSGLPYVMIRKGERAHGTEKAIEGDLKRGDRVLLIDDVATSGGSILKSIDAIRETGAEVTLVTCVVDRLEGASELLRSKAGVELSPLLTIEDLGLSP